MSTALVQELESELEAAKEYLALEQSLNRLRNNADFRKLIVNGFFEKEAIRLVQMKAAPDMQSEQQQKSLITRIDTIGALYQYFEMIGNKAEEARKAIPAAEEALEEIRREANS